MFWKLAGVILIGVGIAGLFLPIIPGIAFILIGLRLISPRHPWLRATVLYVKKTIRSRRQAARRRAAMTPEPR